MRLPASQRQELVALANQTGLSSSDLARLGITWLLERKDVLITGGREPVDEEE